jgi:hypothetical protein
VKRLAAKPDLFRRNLIVVVLIVVGGSSVAATVMMFLRLTRAKHIHDTEEQIFEKREV